MIKIAWNKELFEIGKTIDGRLEYIYNRKRGEDLQLLLTVDNKNGVIHIEKGYYFPSEIWSELCK